MGNDGIEWGLEELTGSVLYDVFYESTTMLAGRMPSAGWLRPGATGMGSVGRRRTGMGCWPPATRWVRRTGGP